MGSIGGLDVAYGANTQIVRTNVMCVNIASAGVSAAGAKHFHNALRGMPSLLAPDFSYFYQTADTDGAGLTQSAQETMFDNDPETSGSALSQSLERGGVLRNLKETPLKPGSAYVNKASSSATASELGAAVAFGATINDIIDATNGDGVGGNLKLEAVLSAGVIDLSSATAGAESDNLFVVADAAAAAATDGGGSEALGVDGLVTGMQTDAMVQAYEQFMATGANNGFAGSTTSAGHTTGGGNAFTLNMLPLLDSSALDGTAGATASDINALTTSSSVGDAIATVVGDATLISVVSLASIC